MIFITNLHSLQLKDRHVFEFHKAMLDKDHILELIFDPQSRKEFEGTKHTVTTCQNVEIGVYKNIKKKF